MMAGKPIGELMDEYDRERIAEIERAEREAAKPGNIAKAEAKRRSDLERDIRAGVRDAEGNYIFEDQDDDEDEDNEEGER
jgi:hypothetical protein